MIKFEEQVNMKNKLNIKMSSQRSKIINRQEEKAATVKYVERKLRKRRFLMEFILFNI